VDSVTNGLDTKRRLPSTGALSAKGNPEIRSLSAILKTMGLRLAVQPIQHPAAHA
jgi:DNA-binding phage protein